MATVAGSFLKSGRDATVTVKVAGATLATDSTTGNVRALPTTTTATLILSQRNQPVDVQDPGVNDAYVYVEGWWETPTEPPSGILYKSRHSTTWAGQTGDLLLLYSAPNPWSDRSIRGQKVRGYFFPR